MIKFPIVLFSGFLACLFHVWFGFFGGRPHPVTPGSIWGVGRRVAGSRPSFLCLSWRLWMLSTYFYAVETWSVLFPFKEAVFCWSINDWRFSWPLLKKIQGSPLRLTPLLAQDAPSSWTLPYRLLGPTLQSLPAGCASASPQLSARWMEIRRVPVLLNNIQGDCVKIWGLFLCVAFS